MPIIKATSGKSPIRTVLTRVMDKRKTSENLLSGWNCTPFTVKDEMEVTKRLWGKNGGRTYKHFIQSFAKDENISPEQAHQIAYQLAEALPEWADFEVLIATHTDTEYLHTHFIVNSVSYVDGHKLQQSRDELQNMKDQSDRLYHEMMFYMILASLITVLMASYALWLIAHIDMPLPKRLVQLFPPLFLLIMVFLRIFWLFIR